MPATCLLHSASHTHTLSSHFSCHFTHVCLSVCSGVWTINSPGYVCGLARSAHHKLYGLSVGRNSVVGTGGMVKGSNPRRSETFRTRPERPWGLPSLLYSAHWVFPRGNVVGAWSWPPTPSTAEVKERVELYLYSSSVPSQPVPGWTLPLLLP